MAAGWLNFWSTISVDQCCLRVESINYSNNEDISVLLGLCRLLTHKDPFHHIVMQFSGTAPYDLVSRRSSGVSSGFGLAVTAVFDVLDVTFENKVPGLAVCFFRDALHSCWDTALCSTISPRWYCYPSQGNLGSDMSPPQEHPGRSLQFTQLWLKLWKL
jgi:hypothetical protein